MSEIRDDTPIFTYDMSKTKTEQGEKLPDLNALYSWQTIIIIGADGKFKAFYGGMDGPGTGEFHDRLVQSYGKTGEDMLAAIE